MADPAIDDVTARRSQADDGSAEAARWVEDALANVRDWFPDAADEELREPLEQAFALATSAGRGEREFHAVFEAELRRAIEERTVVGSAGSVLPKQSESAPMPFHAVAAEPVAETPVADEPAEQSPDEPAEQSPDEPAEQSPDEPAEQSPDEPGDVEERPASDDRARAFGLAVGALRFHDGLSAKEIRDEHGISADYYAEVMQWLLWEIDRDLDGDYPAHVDRARMVGFAGGLDDIHASFEVDRHVRECGGCATYLADLLEAAVRAVEPASTDPLVRRRRRRRAPVMAIKAAELRRYAQQAAAAVPTPVVAPAPADSAPVVAPAPVEHATDGERSERSRRRFAAFAAVVAAAALLIAVLVSGGDDGEPVRADPTPAARAGSSTGERAAATDRAREARRRQAARARREARAARREAQARERREARARARRAAERRRAREREGGAAPASSSPTPAVTPAAPPASPAPAPASPARPNPQPPPGEFGLEP